jgi:small subunit ribosomal protein S17
MEQETTTSPATAAAAEPTGAPAPATTPATPTRGRRQAKVGTVVGNKMAKTVVVAVTSTVRHPLYHRYIRRTAKFYAHDATGRCQVGDEVRIVSTRPLSRLKRWRVEEIVKRAE